MSQHITVRHDAIHIALHAYEERFKTSHVPLSRECAVVLRVAASRPDFTVSASHVAWGVETSLGLASVVQQCRQDADDTSLWHVDGLPQEAARLLEEWPEVKLTIEPVVELVMTHLSSRDKYSGCCGTLDAMAMFGMHSCFYEKARGVYPPMNESDKATTVTFTEPTRVIPVDPRLQRLLTDRALQLIVRTALVKSANDALRDCGITVRPDGLRLIVIPEGRYDAVMAITETVTDVPDY